MKIICEEKLKDMTWIHHGHESIDKSKFNAIACENPLVKPQGGFWASEYTPDKQYISSWEQFYLYGFSQQIIDRFANGYITFKIKTDARIILLNSFKDLELILEKYPRPKRKDDPFSDLCSMWIKLDWVKMAEDGYDGFYVTDNGIYDVYDDLYGWDVESVVLFNIDCLVM